MINFRLAMVTVIYRSGVSTVARSNELTLIHIEQLYSTEPVRCGLLSQVALSFDHLVGNQQKVATDCQTKRSGRLQIYHQLEFGRLLTGNSAGFAPLRILSR